jgi:hypothetical protein
MPDQLSKTKLVRTLDTIENCHISKMRTHGFYGFSPTSIKAYLLTRRCGGVTEPEIL